MSPVIRDLEEQSTWRLVALSTITYGVYAAFYVRRQTLKINQHLPAGDQIPLLLPDFVVALNLASLVLFVPYLFLGEGQTVSEFADIPANLSFLLWGFAARGRMNRLLSATPGQSRWFHGFWTFLFSPAYFNYKLNVLAEERSAHSTGF